MATYNTMSPANTHGNLSHEQHTRNGTPYTNTTKANYMEWKRDIDRRLALHPDKLLSVVRDGTIDITRVIPLTHQLKAAGIDFAERRDELIVSYSEVAYYEIIATLRCPTTLKTLDVTTLRAHDDDYRRPPEAAQAILATGRYLGGITGGPRSHLGMREDTPEELAQRYKCRTALGMRQIRSLPDTTDAPRDLAAIPQRPSNDHDVLPTCQNYLRRPTARCALRPSARTYTNRGRLPITHRTGTLPSSTC